MFILSKFIIYLHYILVKFFLKTCYSVVSLSSIFCKIIKHVSRYKNSFMR